MGCHKSTPQTMIPCQGWVRVVGFDSIGVRLLVMQGRVTIDEVNDRSGPTLFASFEAMMRANRVDPPARSRSLLEQPRRPRK